MRQVRHPRWVAERILDALQDTPVVVVNGARQVGKSTLVLGLPIPGLVETVTLDHPATRLAAQTDPRAFLQRPVDTLVIDEAQLVPEIFRAIKAEVDADRRPGRFLLTGSSRLLAAPDMAASLVGRTEIIELDPLVQSEIDGARTPGRFVDTAFDDHRALLTSGHSTRGDVLERLCRGGFPEAVTRSSRRRAAWFDSYLVTTVNSVIGQRAELSRLGDLPRLVRLCAARSSHELNITALANDFQAPPTTVGAYLDHLEAAFLIRRIPAWSTNVSAKVVRRPKLALVDTGLAAHLTGFTAAPTPDSGQLLGALLETFVAHQLHAELAWSDTMATMHHYRDRDGREVDLVLERPDGRIVAFEVKATSTPRSDHLSGLRFLADRIGERFIFGALLTLSPEALPFGPRLAALPIDALWRT